MVRIFSTSLAIAALLPIAFSTGAFARGNDWYIKDGFGDQMNITRHWFGRTDASIQDRFGDGYAQKKGLFGSKETDVNVLGNQLKRKKGIFGSSEIQGHSILGDTIKTKKGFFGRRTTYVDASGISSAVHDLFQGGKPRPPEPMSKAGDLAPLGDPSAVGTPGSPLPPREPSTP